MRPMTNQRNYQLFALAALACSLLTGCGAGPVSSTKSSSVSSGSGYSAVLAPSSLVFPSQTLSTTSSPQSLTLTNTGSETLTVSKVAVSGAFAETNNCGTQLSVGSNCTIQVTITPNAIGTLSGTLSVTDAAASSPQQVTLSGTGASAPAPAASVSPASYTFASQVLNSTSALGSVTLTNTGNASLTLTGVSVTGDFAQTNNCGSTLAASASCTVDLTFTPTVVGSRAGTLTFGDNAASNSQSVQLFGTGVNAGSLTESPSSLSFGNVVVGVTSSKTVTITNTGGQSVTVTSLSSTGVGFEVSGISTPLTIAPSQSSTLDISFDPSATGSASGTIILANNSSTSSITIPVSGVGTAAPSHEVVLQWDASNSEVIGYETYRGTISGGPYTRLSSSPSAQAGYTDSSVQAGSTYYYVVTSVGTDMVESAYSNEATATVPTP